MPERATSLQQCNHHVRVVLAIHARHRPRCWEQKWTNRSKPALTENILIRVFQSSSETQAILHENEFHSNFIHFLREYGLVKASRLQKMSAWCLWTELLVGDSNCWSTSQNVMLWMTLHKLQKSKKKTKNKKNFQVEHLVCTSYSILAYLILFWWHPSLPQVCRWGPWKPQVQSCFLETLPSNKRSEIIHLKNPSLPLLISSWRQQILDRPVGKTVGAREGLFLGAGQICKGEGWVYNTPPP